MDLEGLKKLHDKAYQANQVTRERAADDMVFYFVTQWDDSILSESQLGYRGEFNILKKAGRQIISDLASNPIEIDFEPVDETRDDAAELLDGMYRKDGNHNLSLEAYENAKQEAIVCGNGAWELYTQYETNRSGDKKQVIRRRPIFEANNCVLWDPNAKCIDKSDATYCSVLTAYSEDGYKELVEELTGEEVEKIKAESFKNPEKSYTFPWIGGEGKKIYVVSFYYREKVKEKLITLVDPFGESIEMWERTLTEVMDELLDQGYEIESDRMVERWQVTKYIASGERILDESIIAGEHISVIPMYGEHAYIEGEEHYEGVTRLAKDPQRLHNFVHSYLADIASRSPREKPIFWPEQIKGFEPMYNLSGADNNYPYLYQNRTDANGNELPIGAIGTLPAPQIPTAVLATMESTRRAVEDVANPGLPQDIADPDLSGKAVLALQARLDMQSMIYQEHYKHAKRRDAEVYASMAPEINDVPRKTKIELPDGTKKEVEIMKAVIDNETGDIVYLNDLRNAQFEVYSKIGTSYSSKKEQTIDRLETMIVQIDPNDPIRKALQLKLLALMDGVNFDDIRDFANKQLVLTGIKQPETPEEEQMLEASKNTAKEPDANMVLAKAEELKGKADIMQEQREGVKMQLEDANAKQKNSIEMYKATTERMKAEIEAQKAGATIRNTNADTAAKQIENNGKILEFIAPTKDIAMMSDDELFQQLAG